MKLIVSYEIELLSQYEVFLSRKTECGLFKIKKETLTSTFSAQLWWTNLIIPFGENH